MFKRIISVALCFSVLWSSTAFCIGGNGEQDVTKFLFEGLDYKKLYVQKAIMEAPQNQPILEKEGLESLINNRNTYKEEELPILSHSRIEESFGTESDSLDQQLSEDFITKKNSAMRKALARPLFVASSEVLCFGLGIYFMSLLPSGGAGFGVGIAGIIFLDILARNLSQGLNIAWYLYLSPLGDPLHDLEIKYAKKKRFLGESLQEKIERTFQDARKDDAMGTKKEKLDRYLSLPVRSKRPNVDIEYLTQLAHGYFDKENKAIAEPILQAVVGHMSNYSERASANKNTKTILYLEGEPGVGKTRLVEFIANSLNLSLLKLQVDSDKFKSTADSPGMLLQAMLNAEHRNAVLFLDEIDRVANKEGTPILNTILPFLDPDSKTFFDDYMGAPLDISHYFIILAGNHELKDQALVNRCNVIKIDHIDEKVIYNSILNTMLPKLCHSEDPNMNLDPSLFKSQIKELIEKSSEIGDKGFRYIQRQLQSMINLARIEKAQKLKQE